MMAPLMVELVNWLLGATRTILWDDGADSQSDHASLDRR